MDLQLKGKVAVVTGGGRGIGLAIARELAEEGAHIAIAEIDQSSAAQAAASLKSIGVKSFAVATDVTDPASVDAMVKAVVKELGPVQILVNNAAKLPQFLSFVEEKNSDRQVWSQVVDVCYHGAINCTAAVIESMIEAGYGKIINMASDAAKVGEPRQAVYAGAKGAIVSFTKSIAKEVGRYGINVNAICPSMTKTEAVQQMLSEEFEKKVVKAYPMRRLGDPRDIAHLAVFLASDRASWITGQAISVNGGYATA
ncbi:MAG: glucose 1-dehydrogenase [Candidatus Abyssobacteria bacterium SURF_5]|uniref:Glucose 1-dehydrogenase n=1 Tax=Abyssobacteria bacterium (strain SURF_5) TaxID=2093360 RepID=A0A3A4NVF4_ABYX5|nr:MAG: glucose 1-dehydrogenase [Candidatus Abyssubacteria bacterium SURF_5]